MGGRVDDLGFKLFQKQVDYNRARADGGCHNCPMHLFIILTLKEEIGGFKAELQQYYDVLYCYGCPKV